jgi:hypothetical protein
MPTSRRDIFRGALAAGLTATFPSVAGAATAMTPALKDRYAQLDAAASRSVFKREPFPAPAIIESVELLNCGKSWLCRVRTKDGAEGISVSNSQQMSVLYPIFVKRIAPFFIGKDARDIEALLEQVTVYESNYKATGLAIFNITSIGFIVVVLGGICWASGISLWRFLVYIREELLIVLGTSSSEPALPRLMLKMENLGCSKAITGLVIPAGYSFNLDGTSIYLTIALLSIAQATNTHLSLRQEIFILFVLMLNSKGAAAVTGGGLITLAATLAALGTVPVAGIALLLGVDRFLSEMRSITNIIGNGVAPIVISRWEGQFDVERARAVLSGTQSAVEDDIMLRESAGVV